MYLPAVEGQAVLREHQRLGQAACTGSQIQPVKPGLIRTDAHPIGAARAGHEVHQDRAAGGLGGLGQQAARLAEQAGLEAEAVGLRQAREHQWLALGGGDGVPVGVAGVHQGLFIGVAGGIEGLGIVEAAGEGVAGAFEQYAARARQAQGVGLSLLQGDGHERQAARGFPEEGVALEEFGVDRAVAALAGEGAEVVGLGGVRGEGHGLGAGGQVQGLQGFRPRKLARCQQQREEEQQGREFAHGETSGG